MFSLVTVHQRKRCGPRSDNQIFRRARGARGIGALQQRIFTIAAFFHSALTKAWAIYAADLELFSSTDLGRQLRAMRPAS